MQSAVFIVAASLLVLGALGVVALPNPVHSALSLVVALFGVAVLFIVLGAHLLAAVQIIVYASAIVVLFLFVIMLIGVDKEEDSPLVVGRLRIAGIGIGVLVSLQLIAIGWDHWVTGPKQVSGAAFTTASEGNVKSVATQLFTNFVWPFQLVAGLLVVAVVGAVVLARANGANPILTEAEAQQAETERAAVLAEQLIPSTDATEIAGDA